MAATSRSSSPGNVNPDIDRPTAPAGSPALTTRVRRARSRTRPRCNHEHRPRRISLPGGFLTDRVVVADHPVILAGWVEDHVGHQGCPPGLVHGAQACAVVAVEVLVTKQGVLPRGVGVQPVDGAVDGSPAVGCGEPDGDEPVGEVRGDRPAGSAAGRSGSGYSIVKSGPKNWSYCSSARMIR